jgi:3D (Asp-Asp-Asp) domain-containing protein
MKQSNFKKCVIGLTLSISLLSGSAIATAKAAYCIADPLQNQEQDLVVMDTKYSLDLAREIESKKQVNHLLALAQPANATAQPANAKAKAVQVEPVVINANVKAAKQVAEKKQKNVVKQAPAAPKEHTLKIPSGNTINYSRLIPVKATAYTAAAEENGMWGAYDYYGNPLKLGTIAVDPDVIPMGSTVFVTGYSFDGLPAIGMIAKATDQGSAVKGKRVDIFVPISQADATKFGIQDVKIYIMQ